MAKKSESEEEIREKKKAAPAGKKKKVLKAKAEEGREESREESRPRRPRPSARPAPKPEARSDGGPGTSGGTGARPGPADGLRLRRRRQQQQLQLFAARLRRRRRAWRAEPHCIGLARPIALAVTSLVGGVAPPIRGRPNRPVRSVEEVRYAGDLQHPADGRVLRVAARLEAPVRRPFDPSGLPAGGSRPDQCRGL